MKKTICIEYMCTFCGRKEKRAPNAGRPEPGDCLRRKRAGGGYWPHRWVVNKRWYQEN